MKYKQEDYLDSGFYSGVDCALVDPDNGCPGNDNKGGKSDA